MESVKKLLGKIADKVDKTRTIDKKAVEKILQNNQKAKDTKKQG